MILKKKKKIKCQNPGGLYLNFCKLRKKQRKTLTDKTRERTTIRVRGIDFRNNNKVNPTYMFNTGTQGPINEQYNIALIISASDLHLFPSPCLSFKKTFSIIFPFYFDIFRHQSFGIKYRGD